MKEHGNNVSIWYGRPNTAINFVVSVLKTSTILFKCDLFEEVVVNLQFMKDKIDKRTW